MEQYKKTVDGQHAPEALIAKTLQRIHEEEKRMQAVTNDSEEISMSEKTDKKKSMRKRLYAVSLAMAAGLALFIGVMSGRDTLIYQTVEGTIVRDMSSIQMQQEMVQGDLEDEGTFFYDVNGKTVVVKVSKTSEVAPEELLQTEPKEWNDMTVYAGKSVATNQYMIATEKDGASYFIIGYDVSEKEFESFLKKFF